MKTLTTAQINSLNADVLRATYLVKFDFPSQTIGLNMSTYDVTYSGLVYKAGLGLISVSLPDNQPGEVPGLNIDLAGAGVGMKALALDQSGEWPKCPVKIYLSIFDDSLNVVLADLLWSGRGDTMRISGDHQSANISASAESSLVDLIRGNQLSYSQADQDIFSPGDRFFSNVLSQVDRPIIWPNKEYFKR